MSQTATVSLTVNTNNFQPSKSESTQPNENKEKEWSNLAKIVYHRTYSRVKENGQNETWENTVRRVIEGNIGKYRDTEFLEPNEEERLFYYLYNRKAMPAGRGLWFSGTEAQDKLGGAGLNNCWGLVSDDYYNFVVAMDLLMLGGGTGMSVEHKHTSKLPKIQKGVQITNLETNDADFIVPDSRQGWCELLRKVLRAYFETGESFSYSCVLVRGAGEPIKGFGGKASGKIPLITFITKLSALLQSKEGKKINPIDAADILCCIGEVVVSGNVRRSAILVQGDPFDKEFLKAKRWDLGNIPTQRAMANYSVNCSDIDDLHPLFWKTYEHGEPFGLVNIDNMRKYARIGEVKRDPNVQITNPCSEVTLASYEPCNLVEIMLPNLTGEGEFIEAATLMYRWAKRVTSETYHHKKSDDIVKKNRRVGVGITGCLQSNLFSEVTLDKVYKKIQSEDLKYSKLLKVPESIRTTVIKPSGTLSLLGDVTAGIHPAYSKYYIRRVRFAANDDLIPVLKESGHYMEPVRRFDGTLDTGTFVVDFPCKTAEGTPTADENWDTWKQLEVLKKAQKYWSDNSVSVTVYYKRDEISKIKEWLTDNLNEIKTISFLCHDEHGFVQAPYEAITKEDYESRRKTIKPIDFNSIGDGELESMECSGGMCPLK